MQLPTEKGVGKKKNSANCVKITSDTIISKTKTLVSSGAPNRIKHVIIIPYPNSRANAL